MQMEIIVLALFSSLKENTYNCLFFKMRKWIYFNDDVIIFMFMTVI